MPKKKVVSEEVMEETVGSDAITVSKVAPLTLDFGRQDLNELRDKINEIIAIL